MQCTIQMEPWEPSQDEIDRKPWECFGYQSFSRFVSSDNDFFFLRRFGALSARVLLELQDQLSRIGEKLEVLERHHRQQEAPDIHNGSFREEIQQDREKFVWDAQRLLQKYNELVLQYSQIKGRPQVPRKDIRSLENWIYNHQNVINGVETEYVNHDSDLFSIVPMSKSPLRLLLERCKHFRLLQIWQQKPPDDRGKDNDIHYISDRKIDSFIASTIMASGLIMLITPLWILAFLGGLTQRLGVISAFIVFFVALISLTTVAKPFESLAAAAAYSAVLMVFLQISSPK